MKTFKVKLTEIEIEMIWAALRVVVNDESVRLDEAMDMKVDNNNLHKLIHKLTYALADDLIPMSL